MYTYRGSRLQGRVEQWSKVAYETWTNLQPDYVMDNGKPRPINQSISQGSIMLEPKFMQGHQQSNTVHMPVIFFDNNINFLTSN